MAAIYPQIGSWADAAAWAKGPCGPRVGWGRGCESPAGSRNCDVAYGVKKRRRKKSARERRDQRMRSEARVVQRMLAAFLALSGHRGCAHSRAGSIFAIALAGALADQRLAKTVVTDSAPEVGPPRNADKEPAADGVQRPGDDVLLVSREKLGEDSPPDGAPTPVASAAPVGAHSSWDDGLAHGPASASSAPASALAGSGSCSAASGAQVVAADSLSVEKKAKKKKKKNDKELIVIDDTEVDIAPASPGLAPSALSFASPSPGMPKAKLRDKRSAVSRVASSSAPSASSLAGAAAQDQLSSLRARAAEIEADIASSKLAQEEAFRTMTLAAEAAGIEMPVCTNPNRFSP